MKHLLPKIFLAFAHVLLSASVASAVITRDVGEIAIIEGVSPIVFTAVGSPPFNPPCPLPTVNVNEAAKKFYQTHNDGFDQLVIFTTFDSLLIPGTICSPGAGAFNLNVSNSISGIGGPIYDNTAAFGSSGYLKSVLHMGKLGGWGQLTLIVLGQETGHQWSTVVQFDSDPGQGISPSDDLLGRALAHWSFFFHAASYTSSPANPEASTLEGNYWLVDQPAPGQFLTSTVVNGFSKLDLYLMGLLPPQSVGPLWYIKNPVNVNPSKTAADNGVSGVQSDGTQTFLTINDIISVEGPRIPAYPNTPKIFKMAFILVTPPGVDATQAEINQINTYRTQWEDYFSQKTGFLGAVVTNLNNVVYVDSQNAGPQDGSISKPFTSINTGIANSSPVDTIVITGGTYPESINTSEYRTFRSVLGPFSIIP